MLVWNHVWLPTLYGAGTHGYAEQWVYSCLLLFFSLFIRLWSRPVDVRRYAYFFEKNRCWTTWACLLPAPLLIFFDTGGDSSRKTSAHSRDLWGWLEQECESGYRTTFLNQNSILKKPAVPVCAVFPAGHRALWHMRRPGSSREGYQT